MGDIYLMMALCGLAFVGLVLTAFKLNKINNPDPRQKVLLPMVAYFIALLALMGFLGSFWSMFKYPVVSIAADTIMIDEEEFPLPKAHEIRLESYTGSGLGETTRVLLVQTRDRRTWAFPDDRYDLNRMMGLLK